MALDHRLKTIIEVCHSYVYTNLKSIAYDFRSTKKWTPFVTTRISEVVKKNAKRFNCLDLLLFSYCIGNEKLFKYAKKKIKGLINTDNVIFTLVVSDFVGLESTKNESMSLFFHYALQPQGYERIMRMIRSDHRFFKVFYKTEFNDEFVDAILQFTKELKQNTDPNIVIDDGKSKDKKV